jgi:hypothetical protein
MAAEAPATPASTYGGRALGWSGKREIVAPEAQPVQQPWWAQQQQPLVAPRSAPQAPASAATSRSRARNTSAYQPPWLRPSAGPPRRPAPCRSPIYDAPGPPRRSPVAYAEPPTLSAAAHAAARPGRRPHLFRRPPVRHEPDPIPAAGPPRMVLIGPPASAPDDDKPREDSDGSAQDKIVESQEGQRPVMHASRLTT